MSHADPVTPRHFDLAVHGRQGDVVSATVTLRGALPDGELTLHVQWDAARRVARSITPYRNLGAFVTEALIEATTER